MTIRIPKSLIFILSFISCAAGSIRVIAQDLVPSKKVIDINNTLLNNNLSIKIEEQYPVEPIHFVERELNIYSADEIYGEWNSIFLTPNSIPSDRLPEEFNIDLTGFTFPHEGEITSGFGVRSKTRNHYGVDIDTNFGDPIKAAYDGKVRIAGYNRNGFGYYVVIRHPNGLETIYAHLNKPLVKKDQEVKAGEVIGKSGKSGRMRGSVLHFEMRFLGTPFNPQRFLNFSEKRLIAEQFTYEKKNHNPIPRVRKYNARKL